MIVKDLATNQEGTGQLYEARKIYRDFSFGQKLLEPVDLWYDNKNFGKVDLDGDAIFVLEKNTMAELNVRQPKFLIDFVADAFNDLKSEYDDRSRTPGKSLILNMDPKKTFIGAESFYFDYLVGLRNFLIESILSPEHEDIKTFGQFFKRFTSFVKTGLEQPLSRTSFILSELNPITTTGLVVEIDLGNHGDDKLKRDWIVDENFDLFQVMANNHGFYVDKNAPWRLIANLASEKMKEYMRPYLVNQSDHLGSFFDAYCEKAWVHDVDYLRIFLIETYNAFAIKYPIYKQGCNFVKREFMSRAKMDVLVDQHVWLELYSEIRSKELKKSLSRSQKQDLLEMIHVSLKYYGYESAISAINSAFKKISGAI